MELKQRCHDVAEAIISYLRQECAIASSDGIETSIDMLAKTIKASTSGTGLHLRRLIDFKIVVLKRGVYVNGNKNPKFFALGEGYEEGDDWKKIYYGENLPSSRKNTNRTLLLRNIVDTSAKATSDKSLLEELVQSYARVKELQEKVLEVQRERNEAIETVQLQKTRIDELEQDLQVTSESARTNQQEIVTLELQLKEARGAVAYHDRKIAKNDGVVRPFANR